MGEDDSCGPTVKIAQLREISLLTLHESTMCNNPPISAQFQTHSNLYCDL